MEVCFCGKPGTHNGYCREHAEYLAQHTTLMLSPAAKVGRVVAALILGALMVVACHYLPKRCDAKVQFYLKGTAAQCR